MALLRDQEDLPALCSQAGEILGLPDGVVEKDYWVAQALRALQAAYPGEFIFKGGTPARTQMMLMTTTGVSDAGAGVLVC